MRWLEVIRLSVLGFVTVCGILAGSFSAHIVAFDEENYNIYYNFAVLGIATGGLTIFTLPVMIIVDLVRKGAFTSLVVVELSWLSILWVLWVATAALSIDQTSAVFSTCDFIYPILNQFCHETQAIEAFAFLAWIVLLVYTVLLLIVALVNASRGAPMWTSTVRESGGIAPAPSASTAVANAGAYPTQQVYHQKQPLVTTTPMSHCPAQGQQALPSPGMQQYKPQPIYPGAYPHQQQQQQPSPSPVSGVSHTQQNGSTVSGYSSYPQV